MAALDEGCHIIGIYLGISCYIQTVVSCTYIQYIRKIQCPCLHQKENILTEVP